MSDTTLPETELKVFISYSWDSDAHSDWVLELANKLEDNGINVILDKFELRVGKPLTHFMEKSVTNADKVLLIMTPNYKEKADTRVGGVGYEVSMVTQELYEEQESEKFVPVLRKGNNKESAPKFLSSFISLDMTKDTTFEEDFRRLLKVIYGVPDVKRRPRGKKPSFVTEIKSPANGALINDTKNLQMCGMTTSAKWTMDLHLNSLADQDKAKLFKLIKSNLLVDEEFKNTLPFILIDSHKVSHHPEIIYEMPLKTHLGHSNYLINEKLKIEDLLIRYEFSEYGNQDFWLLNTVQPFCTLFYLLVILNKIHKYLKREIEIKIEIGFATDRKARLYHANTLFDYSSKYVTYEIPAKHAEMNFDLNAINNDAVFDLFEKLYSVFISENPKSTEPYPMLKRGAFDLAVKDLLK